MLHKMLKQGFVLINDSIKHPFDNPAETAISKENKQKYLLNQLAVLIKWVLNYSPGDANPTAQREALDFLKETDGGKSLQDYTNKLMREAQSISHMNLGNLPVNLRQRQLTNDQQHSSLDQHNSKSVIRAGNNHNQVQPPVSMMSFISHYDNNTSMFSQKKKSQSPLPMQIHENRGFLNRTVEKPSINVSKRLTVGKYETAPHSPLMNSESKAIRVKHSRNNSKDITGH